MSQQEPSSEAGDEVEGAGLAAELDAPPFIVGIGASAGGLEALERLFQAMPTDTGMAFVVIQHLSPDFNSLMDELLARFTKMPIVRVADTVVPERNHIYLLPPRKEMVLLGGRLHPFDKPTDQPLSMPINTFFRSLARDVAERGIAIVLSGTGSDGSLGLCDVHEAGGLVLAQSEETAKFDGMPRSAVATGQVDAVMAPEDMPKALVAYVKNPSAPVLSGSALASTSPMAGVPAVIERLREVYGLDFNYYKPATISRRIDRRVALGHSPTVQAYCAQVLKDSEELDALYKDLLIGVTRFFRDPEAFAVLENTVIPEILEQVPRGEDIRVWVPGCATGEEPYSLAILFLEALETRGRDPAVKIFASDVHRESLQFAAEGLYPETSLTELSATRRDRFFERDGLGARVTAQLRRHILFSHHNVIRDPPFTRMDLVSCRNMLIYLQPVAQLKALASFHFALKHRGFLFLGPSEGVGDLQNEFEAIERHWKIYRKVRDTRLPIDMRLDLISSPSRQALRTASTPGDLRMARIYDAILKRYVPSAVLIDSRREVMHVFGDAERFLRLPPGRMTTDLVSMTRGDMRVAVSSAIQNALKKNEKIAFRGVQFVEEGSTLVVDVIADPISDSVSSNQYVLVQFEIQNRSPEFASTAEGPAAQFTVADEARARIQQLEGELQHAKESLQTTVEELETSNEELQASNEELLAANEELQSTNEELHSVNEELYSVNAEHEQKIRDLNRVSSDLKNLIQATEIGTIFLEPDQRIRFFTPAAGRLFNLMSQDIDRDIRHITSRVKDDDVFEDIVKVSETLTPIEKRVHTTEGEIYLRRIMPYFDVSRAPRGLVLTFVDITALSRAEEALIHLNVELEQHVKELDGANQQLRLIFENAPDGILTVNAEGVVHMVNAQVEQMFGYSSAELVGNNIEMLVPDQVRNEHENHREAFFSDPSVRRMGQVRWLEGKRKDASVFPIEVTLTPLAFRGSTHVMAFITDMTRTKQLETERDQIVRKMTETQKLESLGVLAGGIAHDFNNLLTGIMATAGMLVDDTRGKDELRESANIILESSRRAAELCQQLLAYSGRSKFVLRARDVSELVEATSKLAHASSVHKGLQLKFDLPKDLPLVSMDETQIRQVVMNLVINASEAVDPHAGVVAVRTGKMKVTPELLQTAVLSESLDCAECVFIEVSDNGCGIKPEDLRRIFEPFYTTKFTGRGLGLSAVLGIVRGHRGALSVTSNVGQGTTFRVLLPPASATKPTAPDGAAPNAPWNGSGKVLVADDEASIRNACRRLLTRMGFEVEVVADGCEALERFKQNPAEFALVLLDLTMPRTGGGEAFIEMKRFHPEARIVLMSGFSQDDATASIGHDFVPDGFLPKPFDYAALSAALQQALKCEPPPAR